MMTTLLTPPAPAPSLAPVPSLTPLRRTILVVGGLLSLLVITLTTLSIVDHLAHTSYQTPLEFAAPGTHHLRVWAPHGISVTASTDGRVHVRKSVEYGLARPDFVEKPTADGVVLEANCHGWMAVSSCSVAYEVQVPPDFSIEAVSQTGDVSATGLAGSATLTTTAGTIQASQMSGNLTLHTRAGEVVGIDLGRIPASGDAGDSKPDGPIVEARTSAGDIKLTFAVQPRKVTARTAAGDVEVMVPPGSGYRIEADTQAGEQHVDPSLESRGSDRTIVVTSSAGDVTVRPAAG
jgi:hypothetical protein